jgi:hypothetical protein
MQNEAIVHRPRPSFQDALVMIADANTLPALITLPYGVPRPVAGPGSVSLL